MRVVRLVVAGRVQGVGYRDWTVSTATRLGLKGWVRNRPDGSVAALIAGESAAVDAMVEACRQGPAGARVDRLEAGEGGEAEATGLSGAFRRLPTV